MTSADCHREGMTSADCLHEGMTSAEFLHEGMTSANCLHEDGTTIKCMPGSLLFGTISIHMPTVLCVAAAQFTAEHSQDLMLSTVFDKNIQHGGLVMKCSAMLHMQIVLA